MSFRSVTLPQKCETGTLEKDLEPEPGLIDRRLPSVRCEDDGGTEHVVLPAQIELDDSGQVPIDPDVDGVDPVGPEVRVGQAVDEDLIADIKQAIACGQLDGPRAPPALSDVEIAIRPDDVACG